MALACSLLVSGRNAVRRAEMQTREIAVTSRQCGLVQIAKKSWSGNEQTRPEQSRASSNVEHLSVTPGDGSGDGVPERLIPGAVVEHLEVPSLQQRSPKSIQAQAGRRKVGVDLQRLSDAGRGFFHVAVPVGDEAWLGSRPVWT